MVQIRVLHESDIVVLARMYEWVYKVFDIHDKWTAAAAERNLRFWFKKQPDLLFTALVDGQIAGAIMGAIEPSWDGDHLVDADLFVYPSFQHHGIGKLLLKKLVSEAKAKYQITGIDIYTFKRRDFPLAWYKKLGFSVVDDWEMIAGDPNTVIKKLA